MTETGSPPAVGIFDRLPPEIGSARASIEPEFKALDSLVVRNESGQLLIAENAFRGALQGLSLSDQQINALISNSPDVFTSSSGLPAVPLSELSSSAPQLQPATGQQLDGVGLHVGTHVQALKTAFTNATHADAATLNMSASELRQRIFEALTPGRPQTGIVAEVTGSQFLNCLEGELTWIVVWVVIHALAAWGVSIGAIVVVGISTALLWALIIASFGLGIAILVFRCL
jgi:hypothetical protein